jgi:TPR repeat protein
LLAGVGYLQWASQRHRPAANTASAGRSAAPEPVNTPQPRVEVDRPQPAETQKPAETAAAAGKSPTVQTALATRENINKKPVATSLGSSAQNAGSQAASMPASEATAEAEGGAEELRLAERYLEGKSGARDTAEAGKWLWKAVGKQNSTAAVLLADLYSRGDGVSKNCDQARILLVSATKKGAPQAARALRSLETTGCQ